MHFGFQVWHGTVASSWDEASLELKIRPDQLSGHLPSFIHRMSALTSAADEVMTNNPA